VEGEGSGYLLVPPEKHCGTTEVVMTDLPGGSLSDDDMNTTFPGGGTSAVGDSDGTDGVAGDGTDGTDGTGTDTDGTDGTAGDGTDGTDGTGTDTDGTDGAAL